MATSYHLLSPSQLEGWKFDPMPLSLSEPPQRSLGKSVPLNRPDKNNPFKSALATTVAGKHFILNGLG